MSISDDPRFGLGPYTETPEYLRFHEQIKRGATIASQIERAIEFQHQIKADADKEIARLQTLLQMSYPDQMAEIDRLRKIIKQGADCLEDVAQGKTGWAWEEVLTEMRTALE